jgi:hypothetical protein
VLLDLTKDGSMTFFINGVNMGVAFTDLNKNLPFQAAFTIQDRMELRICDPFFVKLI